MTGTALMANNREDLPPKKMKKGSGSLSKNSLSPFRLFRLWNRNYLAEKTIALFLLLKIRNQALNPK